MDLPHRKVKDGIIIKIRVCPNSSKREWKIIDDILNIKIKSQPVDGEANRELIDFLSEIFSVKKRDIMILKGWTSKNKLIKIVSSEL